VWLQLQTKPWAKNPLHAGMRGGEHRSEFRKARDIEIMRRRHTEHPDAFWEPTTNNQMVTSPSCSVISLTFGPSSVDSSPFVPTAAAKLKLERMLPVEACVVRGEGGSETSPLRVKGGDRGAPLRSAP